MRELWLGLLAQIPQNLCKLYASMGTLKHASIFTTKIVCSPLNQVQGGGVFLKTYNYKNAGVL
jgi:hypothetical protein